MMRDHGAEGNLPAGLSNPARQALESAGISRLEQLTQMSQVAVLKLHGMGPTGIDILRRSLAKNGLSFKQPV